MEPRRQLTETIGFIGGGNMAKAIVEGIISKALCSPKNIYVSGPHLDTLKTFSHRGVHTTTSNGVVVEECDVIFICVKPHILPQAIADVWQTLPDPLKAANKLFVSILAGVTLESLENILTFKGSRVIRSMPNTPLMVGEGCTVFSPGQHATESDKDLVVKILSVLGICKMVPESMINAVGALAGSGPAYIYLVIEAMADGGVMMGIPREMAIQFAAQTVYGAGKMVLETNKHTGQLRDEVCSPGGTTIAAVHELEKGGVRAAFMNAIEAATKKSLDLGCHENGNNDNKK